VLWRYIGRDAIQASCGHRERTVPERIVARELHRAVSGSAPRERSCFDIAWQNRIEVHVGCACGVKHQRGWTEQTIQQALLASIMCLPHKAVGLLQ
jgi:hypothetical protein